MSLAFKYIPKPAVAVMAFGLLMLTLFLQTGSAAAKTGTCFFNSGTGPVGSYSSGTKCSIPGNGTAGTNDVLTGRTCVGCGKAIPNSVNNKTKFIAFILDKFNNGGTHDQIGAAFIIQEMRSTTDHSWPSAADITQWTNLMNQPGVTFSRDDKSVGTTSFYDNVRRNTFYANHSSTVRDVITIRQGGARMAEIESECGNMVAGAVPISPSNWNLAPTSSVTPIAHRGTNVTFNHTVKNNGPDDMTEDLTERVMWSTSASEAPAGQAGKQVRNCDLSGGLDDGDSRACDTSFTIPVSAANGQKYCQFIKYGRDTRTSPATTNGPKTCVTVHVLGVTCAALNAGSPEVGDNVNLTIGVSTVSGTFAVSAPHNFSYTITPPSGPAISGSATSATQTKVVTVPNVIAGTYNVVWTYSGGSGIDTISKSCSSSFTVAAKPYFKIYGGDVLAGGGSFRIGAACTTPSTSKNLRAFNKGSAGGYKGSGTQIAALAYGLIDGFMSANTALPLTTAKHLSFANNQTTAPFDVYGGDFQSNPCVHDYMADIPPTSIIAGPHTVNPAGPLTLGAGAKTDIVVNGNVYIKNNVVYAGGSWANIDQIPSFRLIVRGNIYIDSDVSQLDGMYIAIPTMAGAGGIIYTCALGFAAPAIGNVATAAKCSAKPLVINGAFIAKQVKLLRLQNTTNDDVPGGASPNRAAEIFNYTPEVWMARPLNPAKGGTTQYDSITSLPPIL